MMTGARMKESKEAFPGTSGINRTLSYQKMVWGFGQFEQTSWPCLFLILILDRIFHGIQGPYLFDSKLLFLSYYWFLHAHHLCTWQSSQTHKPHTFPHILFVFSLGPSHHEAFLKFIFSLWILMLTPLLPYCLAPEDKAESAWFLVPYKHRHMSWVQQTLEVKREVQSEWG